MTVEAKEKLAKSRLQYIQTLEKSDITNISVITNALNYRVTENSVAIEYIIAMVVILFLYVG